MKTQSFCIMYEEENEENEENIRTIQLFCAQTDNNIIAENLEYCSFTETEMQYCKQFLKLLANHLMLLSFSFFL